MYRALLICNSTYPEDASLKDLQGPRLDGLVLWKALTDPATGYFSPEDVDVLYERTSSEVLRSIELFFNSAQSGDTVLLYFSGHGRRVDRELVLCSRDTNTSVPRSSGVPCDEVSKIIKSSSAEVTIVILDCCHSGAFKGDDDISHDLAGHGRYVLAATQPIGLADDSQEKSTPSPFTQPLVEGLSQASDGDGDGLIELDELFHYVDEKLQEKGYSPHRDFTGAGDIKIARISSVQEGPIGNTETGIPESGASQIRGPRSTTLPGRT
jgi:hypothetical protein